jgi:hypothetical protein
LWRLRDALLFEDGFVDDREEPLVDRHPSGCCEVDYLVLEPAWYPQNLMVVKFRTRCAAGLVGHLCR